MATPEQQAFQQALLLLGRRDHAPKELRDKLRAKGHEPEIVEGVLAKLQADGYLDPARFTESFVASRTRKGHGPLRIRQDLRQRGIEAEPGDETDWLEPAKQARRKRFGPELPGNLKEKARQARFLTYRGFPGEVVRKALEEE